MVPWWKRILYSLFSVLIADCVGLLILLASALAQRGFTPPSVRMSGALMSFSFVLVYSAPGWLLALPAVLAIRTVDGWRLWFSAVLGSSIGPGVMYGMALYFSLRTGYFGFPEANVWTVTAAVISVVATLTYIYFMKRGTRRLRDVVAVK
jgi:hypothetical protein